MMYLKDLDYTGAVKPLHPVDRLKWDRSTLARAICAAGHAKLVFDVPTGRKVIGIIPIYPKRITLELCEEVVRTTDVKKLK